MFYYMPSVTYRYDFVHKKRHMDFGGWGGGGLAPVTFLGEKSWKISIV